MDNKQTIRKFIEEVAATCLGWVDHSDNGQTFLIDPNDKEEISAHYGATHAAAAFIIYGLLSDNEELRSTGVKLLKSILARWDESILLPAYHFDFNNFALCTIYNHIKDYDQELASDIKDIVLRTQDSNNPTTNWLPMRWFVNKCRYQWTSDDKYKVNINNCIAGIKAATNFDGGIEDRLPKGTSFNLQYDVATKSVLQYLNVHGEDINLSKEIAFLLNRIAPDGDINYQGRGTNQIFGWSCWVYLLASANKEKELEVALNYLRLYVPDMLKRNNMMLNCWDGTEKFLWWDYHYCSVYISHFLFWLVLSLEDYGKHDVETVQTPIESETGLNIYKNDDAFIAVFSGRKEYLSEKGPSVSAIWTKRDGMIFKGSFAPWQGLFGNMHTFYTPALHNFFGLLEVKKPVDLHKNRLTRKISPYIHCKTEIKISPLFAKTKATVTENKITISYDNPNEKEVVVNIPCMVDISNLKVYSDSSPIDLFEIMTIRNQYGYVKILQSKIVKCKKITIDIETK